MLFMNVVPLCKPSWNVNLRGRIQDTNNWYDCGNPSFDSSNNVQMKTETNFAEEPRD